MKKELKVILLVLSFNYVLGYLFQLSNEIICFTELSFLALGGTIFWLAFYQPLKKYTLRLFEKNGLVSNHLLTLGGLGVLTSILNLFFCQFFVISTFTLLFGCESPSFNTLTASLTNNIAGNFICYTALVGLIIHNFWQQKKNIATPPEKLINNSNSCILLPYLKTKIKVNLDDISHIQVTNNCITIFANDKKFVKYQSLSSFAKALPADIFKRVHRSTIININHIQEVETNANNDGFIFLKNGEKVRFSRSYKKEFLV